MEKKLPRTPDPSRRWRYIVLAAATVVIIGVALSPYFKANHPRAGPDLYEPFQKELIDIMAEGQPEGANTFPVLLQIRDLLLKTEAEFVKTDITAPGSLSSDEPEATSTDQGTAAEQFARARAVYEAAKARGLNDLAATYTAGPRFVRPLASGPPVETPFDELGTARALARVQSVRMRVAADSEDNAEFLKALGQTLAHARFLCFEPVSFGRSVGISIYALAIEDIRYWLAARPADGESLAAVARLFDEYFPPPPVTRIIRGEYVVVRSAIADVYANGNEGLHRLSGAQTPRPEAAPFPETRMGPGMPSLEEHKRIAEEFFADLLRVASMPRPKRVGDTFQPGAVEEWMHQKSLIVALCLSGFKATFNAEDQINAEEAGVRTMVALERCRLKRGSYPASLGDLVPEFLPAVPGDPYTGAALVYRLGQNADSLPDQYVLYSAGTDGIDNGGKFDGANRFKAVCDCPEGEGLDLLLNPARPD